MYYYSKATGGFYHGSVHNQIPMDRVEVSDEQHGALMKAQAEGKVIQAGEGGFPVAVEPPEHVKTPQQHIADLEAAITPRRLREAMLGVDDGWLRAQDDKIAAFRLRIGPRD